MEVDTARRQTSKRRRDDDDVDVVLPPPPGSSNRSNNNMDLSLLEALEKSQSAVEVLDLRTLKRLVLSFERRLKENIEARLKYPNQPDRFSDSELDLHEELHKLKILAGGPELYPDLVNLNAIPSVLNLLAHDNTDIADDDDNNEHARILVDALVENNVLELLVQNLHRLPDTGDAADPDEMAAVYSTLATIENLIEVKPAVAELACERTKLLKWLLGRIKVREFDSNKQYASKILAILLQSSTANQGEWGR